MQLQRLIQTDKQFRAVGQVRMIDTEDGASRVDLTRQEAMRWFPTKHEDSAFTLHTRRRVHTYDSQAQRLERQWLARYAWTLELDCAVQQRMEASRKERANDATLGERQRELASEAEVLRYVDTNSTWHSDRRELRLLTVNVRHLLRTTKATTRDAFKLLVRIALDMVAPANSINDNIILTAMNVIREELDTNERAEQQRWRSLIAWPLPPNDDDIGPTAVWAQATQLAATLGQAGSQKQKTAGVGYAREQERRSKHAVEQLTPGVEQRRYLLFPRASSRTRGLGEAT